MSLETYDPQLWGGNWDKEPGEALSPRGVGGQTNRAEAQVAADDKISLPAPLTPEQWEERVRGAIRNHFGCDLNPDSTDPADLQKINAVWHEIEKNGLRNLGRDRTDPVAIDWAREAHQAWVDDAPKREEAAKVARMRLIQEEAEREYDKLCARDIARKRFNAEQMGAAAAQRKLRLLDGWEFMDEDEGDETPVWGTEETPVWAVGEPLMIFGPNGVGKSTLSHQLVFARIGLIKQVMGMPVLASPGKVFYVAADRPKQIKRAMRRLRKPEHREIIKERLIVHKGPLPFDVTIDKDALADLAQSHGATTIFIDSLKDVCSKPSNEESANGYNTARQEAIARGIEWVEDHHNRKASDDNKTPNTIEDVYGSRWLTAGAGSVICLWGEAGSTSVKLTQLKSPGGFLQPQDLTINHATGEIGAHVALGIMDVIRNGGKEGITVADAARFWTGKDKPTKSEMEGARGKLNRLVKQGTAMTYEHKTDKLTRYYLSPVAAPQMKVSTGYQQDGLGPGW